MDKIKRPKLGVIMDNDYGELLLEKWGKASDEILEKLATSPKRGQCTITKLKGNCNGEIRVGNVESGYCPGLVEGYSCVLDAPDRWFHTSIIQSIDWEKGEFETLNSVYKFKFMSDGRLNS